MQRSGIVKLSFLLYMLNMAEVEMTQETNGEVRQQERNHVFFWFRLAVISGLC